MGPLSMLQASAYFLLAECMHVYFPSGVKACVQLSLVVFFFADYSSSQEFYHGRNILR